MAVSWEEPFRVHPEVIQSRIERGLPVPMGTVKLILALNIMSRMIEDETPLFGSVREQSLSDHEHDYPGSNGSN